MQLQDLSAHEQELVEQNLQFLTHEHTPECDCCGFAHGVLDILAMAALEAREGDRDAAYQLLVESLTVAIVAAEERGSPAIRSLDDAPDSYEQFGDGPGYCEVCSKWHPFFDILAIEVLCGLKTKEDLESGFSASFVYLQQFMQQES